MNKIGVDIIQPIIPDYRIPFFNALYEDNQFSISIQCASEWPKNQ